MTTLQKLLEDKGHDVWSVHPNHTVLDAIRVLITMKPKEKGDVFERVVQLYLKTHPEYQSQLSEVWMLNEVPKRIRTKLNLPDTDALQSSAADGFDDQKA